ncbi:hypothetical protein YpsIP31758_3196 [Yersinia pseudotuberculosis IP 31758]|uniref:Uncharacterized protein n=1 Tax=Yersinia pseudotuberculosis serotype O:1b (strain IP 31758) TaxID=349747 RepID=A0A0U1QVT7_YERP3|nr:hypothetical protein YpsIP31758_3196 [Yersinia pseudotuberculosis IP 31758]
MVVVVITVMVICSNDDCSNDDCSNDDRRNGGLSWLSFQRGPLALARKCLATKFQRQNT